MKKKMVKRKSSKKKTEHSKAQVIKLEKSLTENFVALQKVMTNMSEKFDKLTTQFSEILEIFENAAKALAKKDYSVEKSKKDDEEVLKKLSELSDQNKIIAKGLTLIHSSQREPAQQMQREYAPVQREIAPTERIEKQEYQEQAPTPFNEAPQGYQESISQQKFNQLPRG